MSTRRPAISLPRYALHPQCIQYSPTTLAHRRQASQSSNRDRKSRRQNHLITMYRPTTHRPWVHQPPWSKVPEEERRNRGAGSALTGLRSQSNIDRRLELPMASDLRVRCSSFQVFSCASDFSAPSTARLAPMSKCTRGNHAPTCVPRALLQRTHLSRTYPR
jgi:hypothetical protein